MKKVILLTIVFIVCLSVSAFAGTLKPGQSTSCNDAKSITIEVAKISNKVGDKWGYTSNDRGTANLVVWKSSTATTVPLTLGPMDDNRSLNGTDGGRTGLDRMGTMGFPATSSRGGPIQSRGWQNPPTVSRIRSHFARSPIESSVRPMNNRMGQGTA